uniref:Uncharacterized protein n=1 Tax=Arundo donax TaxID=35708 RepID=A0A0A9HIU8_ARUDO
MGRTYKGSITTHYVSYQFIFTIAKFRSNTKLGS